MIFGKRTAQPTDESVVIENMLATVEVGEIDETPTGLQEILAESSAEMFKFNAALYISDAIITDQVLREGAEAEPLLEAFVKDTWTRLKTLFTNLWAKVRGWFDKAKQSLRTLFMSGEKFAKEYGQELNKKSVEGFSYTGYPFDIDQGVAAYTKRRDAIASFLKSEVNFEATAGQKAVTDANSDGEGTHGQENHIKNDASSGSYDESTAKEKLLASIQAKDVADAMSSVRKTFRGSDERVEIKSPKIHEMVAFLSASGASIKKVEEAQKVMNDEFKQVLTSIDRAKSSINSSKASDQDKARFTAYATHKYNVAHYALNVQQSLSSTLVSCFEEAAREYSRVLKSFMSYKPAKEGFEGPASSDESPEHQEQESIFESAQKWV